jgi:hypothetical protein
MILSQSHMNISIRICFCSVLLLALAAPVASAQFVTRDKRWPTRGPWMWELPRELPNLYREFNGIDFGHAHIGETLLRTQDEVEVERARVEVLDFIFSAPGVPPDEEQIAPTLVRLAWEVQRAFHWAHSFHRSLYDLFAADAVPDKEAAYHRILGDYLSKPEALTFHPLDHHGKLWSWPESKAFRDKFPKFNTQIWAYHWLQAAAYDVQLMGPAARQRALMPRIIEHYHGYLRQPPEDWESMPMMMEAAPEFSMKFPEAANIFDNLHMLHDNLDDILSRPDLYPTHKARRERVLNILDFYLHRHHAGRDRYEEYHGAMHPAPMHGMKGMPKGMEGMEPMGPRPPSARDVLEGRTGHRPMGGGPAHQEQERNPSNRTPRDAADEPPRPEHRH